MTTKLLPSNFDEMISQAVQVFWQSRMSGTAMQGGTRGRVVSGKNLDGFLGVVMAVADHCGIPESSVFTTGRTNLTLPGYYRPNKNWDAVIVDRNRLVAVIEFKSMVGSFGNNFNNRSEEVIGSAADLWAAAKDGAYHPQQHKQHQGAIEQDPRAPFLGYLMLLQDCDKSRRPVKADSPHYHLSSEFTGASYAGRYKILCERLMKQGLYAAASVVMSEEGTGRDTGSYSSLSPATNARNLFAQLAGHLLASTQT